MIAIKPAYARRLRDLEADAAEAPQGAPRGAPRTHYFFRNPEETMEDIRAQFAAMKRSGEAQPGDKYVVFQWKDDADDPPVPAP